MPLLHSRYTPSSYRLGGDLQSTAEPRRLMQAEPGQADREELLLQKLGPRGWGRLHHFRHYYGPGWGEGRGKALSPRAVEAFYAFLKVVEFSDGVRPSIFLTDDGGLELSWEDAVGKSLQVAFLPSKIEIYRAADEYEAELPHASAAEAAQLLHG